jgi:uncharacterized membrane protein YdbT with pleckstrin-like domain
MSPAGRPGPYRPTAPSGRRPSSDPSRGRQHRRRRAPRSWHPEDIIRDYLVDGEEVKLDERRSFRARIMDKAWILGSAAVVRLVLVSLTEAWSNWLAALVLVGTGGYLAVAGARTWFTRYVITDLRVLRLTGVFNRQVEFIPWGKVTDICRTESLVQWWLGTATIRIESANERSAFRAMTDVEEPDRFYRKLVHMVDLKQGRVADPRND